MLLAWTTMGLVFAVPKLRYVMDFGRVIPAGTLADIRADSRMGCDAPKDFEQTLGENRG